MPFRIPGMSQMNLLISSRFFMKNLLLTPVLLFLSGSLFAQNLIPNYSFEDLTECPSTYGQIYYAEPWVLTAKNPDLFNACNGDPLSFNVPVNGFGNQPAFTGDGYSGFLTITWYNLIYEYCSAPLTSTLVAERCYYGEMYLSLSDASKFAMDKLGMYFTNGIPVADASGHIEASPAPQVYATSIVVDKENWVKVSGVFVATGDETHVTIGNFFPETDINIVYVGSSSFLSFGYYYADDISLYEVDENTVVDYSICSGECLTIGSNEYCDAGTYTVNLPECTFTINITMQDNGEVVIAPVSNIDCQAPNATIDAAASTGLSTAVIYRWTGPNNFSSTLEVVEVTDPGWYTFTIVSSAGCVAKDSIEVEYQLPGLSIAPLNDWDCISS